MLHEHEYGAHWLWVALQRVSCCEDEMEVMKDYGCHYVPYFEGQEYKNAD